MAEIRLTGDMSLRAATYNIHNGVGRDGRFDPSRIARVLVEIDADIVALQEVTLDHAGEFLRTLEAATKLHSVEGPIFETAVGRYGNVVLTRYPVAASRAHDLSVSGRERRGILDVSIQIGVVAFRIWATHLGLNKRERRIQLTQLASLLAATPSAAILLGDLNIPWSSKSIRPLTAIGFRQVGVPSFPTWPAPVAALDRILARPPVCIRNYWRHNSPLARAASDHFPVLADLEIGQEQSC